MGDLISVVIVQPPSWLDIDSIESRDLGPTAARKFDIRLVADDSEALRATAASKVHAIVTFGNAQERTALWNATLDTRKRWLNYESKDIAPTRLAADIMATFVRNATEAFQPDVPLVSVFTPTYMTGDRIVRPYDSLLRQTYSNWEWVVFDDSPDGGSTFGRISRLAERDPRISVYRAGRPCGIIGEVKRRACNLARGSILVELDHDDELTSNCLSDIVKAFGLFPEAGFVYTDCAEVSDAGENLTYGPTFAFGHGSYRRETYGGKTYEVTNYPGINAKTIRHIVGVPNHARAWRRDLYHQIGGHAPDIHVCDDYEILLRTFLATRMVHVKSFGYIQYHGAPGSNTQRKRNAEIQRLVAYFQQHYDSSIHSRLSELGVPDFIWKDGVLAWNASAPDGAQVDANLVYVPEPEAV